jgi:hypothetical protein
MRNALAHVPKGQHTMVAAAIRQAFLQTDAAHQTWRHVADQLRGRWPKLAALMDDSEHDVLAYMTMLSRGDYHWKHECCWYAVREGKTSHWQGDRTQTTVWEVPNNNPFGSPRREESWGHGAQKPVECMRRPIVNNTRPGELVYDPFLGSGTSLIAAEMTGRLCYGLELCPAYVDVVVRRWQAFTGRAAIHQASGQPFDERAAGQDQDRGPGHG